MRLVEISIDRSEQIKRFEREAWKIGRSMEQPQNAKQVSNFQADKEDATDNGLMEASFEDLLHEAMGIIGEYIADSPQPSYGTGANANIFTITLNMPQNWLIHSAPGLKYAILELIYNGMMADWCDGLKTETANSYRKKAELNKAQISSIIYALNAP